MVSEQPGSSGSALHTPTPPPQGVPASCQCSQTRLLTAVPLLHGQPSTRHYWSFSRSGKAAAARLSPRTAEEDSVRHRPFLWETTLVHLGFCSDFQALSSVFVIPQGHNSGLLWPYFSADQRKEPTRDEVQGHLYAYIQGDKTTRCCFVVRQG